MKKIIALQTNILNHIKASLKMGPFESFQRRKCSTPVNWDNPMVMAIVAPKLLREMKEKVIKLNRI